MGGLVGARGARSIVSSHGAGRFFTPEATKTSESPQEVRKSIYNCIQFITTMDFASLYSDSIQWLQIANR